MENSIDYEKVRDHYHYTKKYRGSACSIFNLKFPNEIGVVFLNGANCDFNFIIKELTNGFERKFECLGENTEKYKSFLVSIEKRRYKS